MKKHFLSLIAGIAICAPIGAFAQTVTAVFQPGPSVGKDVHIFMMDNDCIPAGFSTTPANLNFADSVELPAIDWTWNAAGCSGGTIRSLIAFTELSTIPPGSTIVSAKLELFGMPSSTYIPQGNNYYPGSPYPNTNPADLYVINGPWAEALVTWNSAPPIATTPFLTIPASTTQWNYNFSTSAAALVAQVQNWVNAPATNHGFLMRLSNEVHYRSIDFASSDHPIANIRPKLTVEYIAACNANFNFCSSTINPYQYTFTAADASGTNIWNISPAGSASPASGTGSSFTTTFAGPGSYTVVLTHINPDGVKCERKFNLCVTQNAMGTMSEVKSALSNRSAERKITVAPNPVTVSCEVHYEALSSGNATINIFDILGKKVYHQQVKLREGTNKLHIPTQSLASGQYVIQLADNDQIFSERILKQ